MQDMRIYEISEISESDWHDLSDKVSEGPVMITLNEKPIGVLSNPNEFQVMQAMMESISLDRGRLTKIWENHERFKRGERQSFKKINLDTLEKDLSLQ